MFNPFFPRIIEHQSFQVYLPDIGPYIFPPLDMDPDLIDELCKHDFDLLYTGKPVILAQDFAHNYRNTIDESTLTHAQKQVTVGSVGKLTI